MKLSLIFAALIANSRRNSSDFETEWPTWTVPKIDNSTYSSGSKGNTINGREFSLKTSEIQKPTNFPSFNSPGDITQAPKPKIKNTKKDYTATESTKSLYEAASNAASALLSTQEELDLPNLDSSDSIDPTKAAKAAAKAERKQVKKAEKERRKLEKKKRKILERQQQQMKEVSEYIFITNKTGIFTFLDP